MISEWLFERIVQGETCMQKAIDDSISQHVPHYEYKGNMPHQIEHSDNQPFASGYIKFDGEYVPRPPSAYANPSNVAIVEGNDAANQSSSSAGVIHPTRRVLKNTPGGVHGPEDAIMEQHLDVISQISLQISLRRISDANQAVQRGIQRNRINFCIYFANQYNVIISFQH